MPASSDLVALVTILPTACLLLSPAFVIEAVSEAYLAATLSPRERLVGQYLFDAFPDNPRTPEAQSVHNLRASLAQVLATGQPHEMAQQHYDVPDFARPGQFIERHWLPLNTPLLDPQGQVIYLLHSARDVTAEVQTQAHLHASQAAEQAARADAEAQRQHLFDILMQLPAQVAVNRGVDHVYDLVNPRYQQQFPARVLQGLPVRQALPELAGQQFFELLDHVYQTGEPFYGRAMPAAADYTSSGQPELRYFDVFFQALRDAQGHIDGVLNFAYDVTAQVTARRQLEQLNHELEARVQARTQEAQAARAAAEVQYGDLRRVFEQAPVAIAVFRGPDYVLDVVNPRMAAMWDRAQPTLLGQPFFAALPELEGQGLRELLDEVRQTGLPFAAQQLPVQLARHRPGQRGYYDFVYEPLRDEQQQVVAIICIATDLTEQVLSRQQAEALQADLLAAAQR